VAIDHHKRRESEARAPAVVATHVVQALRGWFDRMTTSLRLPTLSYQRSAFRPLQSSLWLGDRLCSCSKGELSLSEVVLLLLLSEGLERALVLGESSSESSGLLLSEIVGGSALGVSASLVSSLLVDHSKNLSDGLSHNSYASELDLGGS
jgi:hypothetical protein